MRTIILLAVASVASSSTIQEVVDNLFDKYLPRKATWEEVKNCREQCHNDEILCARCPKYECPFTRISEQCDIFNSTMAAAKACHMACEHDFTCHFKCPMAKPTTMEELQGLGQAMMCHTRCGHDKSCHKACASPWAEKHARCEKLEAVTECFKTGGSHSTCPHLDEETKKGLMQDPWSLPADIANHVIDHVLPIPTEQQASQEEVKACHMRCGYDHECHRNCPSGVYGLLKSQCNTMNEAHACHNDCEQSETKCPFKKTECHFKCPSAMPASVKELNEMTVHVLCHMGCGQDKSCHNACPSSIWEEKKAQCMKYDEVVGCHRRCGMSHACHRGCPRFDQHKMGEVKEPNKFFKEVVSTLLV